MYDSQKNVTNPFYVIHNAPLNCLLFVLLARQDINRKPYLTYDSLMDFSDSLSISTATICLIILVICQDQINRILKSCMRVRKL